MDEDDKSKIILIGLFVVIALVACVAIVAGTRRGEEARLSCEKRGMRVITLNDRAPSFACVDKDGRMYQP
jgi:hypothetical protein